MLLVVVCGVVVVVVMARSHLGSSWFELLSVLAFGAVRCHGAAAPSFLTPVAQVERVPYGLRAWRLAPVMLLLDISASQLAPSRRHLCRCGCLGFVGRWSSSLLSSPAAGGREVGWWPDRCAGEFLLCGPPDRRAPRGHDDARRGQGVVCRLDRQALRGRAPRACPFLGPHRCCTWALCGFQASSVGCCCCWEA